MSRMSSRENDTATRFFLAVSWRGLLLLPFLYLCAQALLLLPELGGERRTEIFRLEHLANLDLGLLTGGIRATLDPFDRLFFGLHVPQPESGDQLLRLSEWSVDHGPSRSREPDPRALRARMEPLTRQQHAGFD